MSLPALPDIFGNYVLGDDFNEIAAPPAIDWLPQTPGWYMLGAIALAYLLRWSWRRLRYWHRNRYRREARRALGQLQPGTAATQGINQILKRAALAAFHRADVAPLSGTHWTDFLNQHCPQPTFDRDLCLLLAEGVYRGAPLEPPAFAQLQAASQQWLATHRNRFGD